MVRGLFLRRFAALASCLFGFCMAALPQTQGQITGEVTDPAGAVVVGAAVTVTNPETNFTRQNTTNSAGIYTFPALQPGLYNVKVEMAGFRTEVRNCVELQVEQVARIDFRLKVGAITETVEVTGGTPLLNTEDATVGTVIDHQRIVDLPLNGRNFLQLMALSTNVTANFANGGQSSARLGGDRSAQQFSISGVAAIGMRYPRRNEQHRRQFQQLSVLALDRRVAGVQSTDGRLLSRVRA